MNQKQIFHFFENRIDGFVKSQKAPVVVIPANARIQENQPLMQVCEDQALYEVRSARKTMG